MINSQNKVSIRELLLVTVVAISLLSSFFAVEKKIVNLKQIDTAYFLEMVDSIAKTGLPLSSANHTSRDAASTFSMEIEKFCKLPLTSTLPLYRNAFDNHAYYILYAFAPLAWVIPAKTLGPMLHVFPFIALVLIAYFFIRYQGIGPVGAGIFCLLVIAHPNWAEAIQGQYYVDRWFLPMGLLLGALAYRVLDTEKSTKLLIALCIVAITSATIHERAALSGGGFLIALCVFNFRKFTNTKHRTILLLLGGLMITYAILISLTFKADQDLSTTVYYGDFFTRIIGIFVGNFKSDAFVLNIAKFFIVNVLFLGLLALASPRAALIAFAAMLPNILGDIGGAEKTGWSTHYHTTYFPFLILAAGLGYSSLYRRFDASPAKKNALYTGVGVAFIAQLTFNHDPGKFSFTFDRIENHPFVMTYGFITGDTTNNSQRVFVEQRDKLVEAIPLGSTVTTQEGFFPSLYEGRIVLNYPIGIDTADYAVIAVAGSENGKPVYSAPVTYNGAESSKRLGICMNERLVKAGYNVANPRIIGDFAILQRASARYSDM